jgi:hypothetical protein
MSGPRLRIIEFKVPLLLAWVSSAQEIPRAYVWPAIGRIEPCWDRPRKDAAL